MKLTSKQEAFAQHYALHGSAVEAYKAAGYSWKRMKNEALRVNATKLVAHATVSLRIADLKSRVQKRAEEKFDLTADAILLQYQRIAFADAGDFYEWDGETAKPKTFDKLTKEQRQIICGIKQSRGNTNSIEMVLADRMRALDVLAKHLGIGKETVKHEHTFVDDAATDFDSRLAGLVTRATAAGDSRQLN